MNLGVFMDVNNLFHGCRTKCEAQVDYIKVHQELEQFGVIFQGYAYGHQDRNRGLPHLLTNLGYFPKWLPNYNVNVTLAMDLAKLLKEAPTLDGVAFLSNDLNLLPCVEFAKELGKKTVTIGFRLQKQTKRAVDKWVELGHDHLLERKNVDRPKTSEQQVVMPSDSVRDDTGHSGSGPNPTSGS